MARIKKPKNKLSVKVNHQYDGNYLSIVVSNNHLDTNSFISNVTLGITNLDKSELFIFSNFWALLAKAWIESKSEFLELLKEIRRVAKLKDKKYALIDINSKYIPNIPKDVKYKITNYLSYTRNSMNFCLIELEQGENK